MLSKLRLFNLFRRRGENNVVKEQKHLDKKLVYSLSVSRFPTFKQLRHLPAVLSQRELLVIQILSIFIVISSVFLGVKFCQRHIEFVPKKGGEYTEGLVGAPQYINPILSQTNDSDMDLSRLIFSGLLKYNQNQELVPDLAESYEISEDQKTYTFHLKKDVLWHDGETLTANDIIFTVGSIQDSEYTSPLLSSLRGVEVYKIDDYTLDFRLKEPFAPFLCSLTFGILPEHLWIDIPPENFSLAEYNLKPIGSGPFQFKSLIKDKAGNLKSYVLERNKDYYGDKPYLNKIVFRFYPDLDSAIEAAKNKDIEGISYISKDAKEKVAKNKKIISYSIHLPQYTAIFFNQKNPLLKIKEVRQALAYGLDRQKILDEALKQEGEIINTPILPGYIGHNPEVQQYNYDPQKALEILDKAGWKKNEETGIRQKDDQELAFALTTTDQPEYIKTTAILKDYWEKMGFRIEIKIMDGAKVQKEVIKPRNYEAFLYGEIIGTDPDPYPFWHSSQSFDPGLNLAIFYNKDVDQLLEEARKTNDLEQRRLKYLHFQNILAEELPAIFLYTPVYTYGLAEKIKGFNIERLTIPSDRFIEIEKWYIKTSQRWK